MEKAKDSIQDIYNYDYLLCRAVDLMQEYESNPQNEINTLLECSNVQFLGGLEFVGRSLFGGLDLSSDALLLALCSSVYVSLVNKYGKTASIEGFGFFAMIDPETVQSWQADAKTLKKGLTMSNAINELLYIYNTLYFKELSQIPINNHSIMGDHNILKYNYTSDTARQRQAELLTTVNGLIYNRLTAYRETALKYKMIDGKQQIGAIAVANNEYGWSADRIGKEERARALTLADLPKLSNYVNSEKLPEIPETTETA